MTRRFFNLGDKNFNLILKFGNYVDKTELILHLNKLINTKEKYVCISKPEGFGKTTTIDMLVAYYSHTDEETTNFNDKRISNTENWDDYLGKFNTIKLNMKDFFCEGSIEDGINEIKNLINREVDINFKDINFYDKNNIKEIMYDLESNTNRGSIFFIDDWDYVLQNTKFNRDSCEIYIDFLCEILIYNPNVSLVYMTGILPINLYEIKEDFKIIFQEYSMASPGCIAKYFGFTDDEVKELCEKLLNNRIVSDIKEVSNKIKTLNDGSHNNIDKEKVVNSEVLLVHKNEINYENLKDWYSGYQLFDSNTNEKYKIYSPYSILNAIKNRNIKNYQMSCCSVLYEYIQKNFDILKDVIILLIEQQQKILKLDKESLLTQKDEVLFKKKKNKIIQLVHLGYFGYDNETNEIFIPNKEICEIFKSFIDSEDWLILNKRNITFNSGDAAFIRDLNESSEYYVDKTELILRLNKIVNNQRNCVCVSRPRRFGKTYAADMLSAYYSYTESNITVFNDKNISKTENWNQYLGKFNVIKLNMIQFFTGVTIKDGIKRIKNAIIEDAKNIISNIKCNNENTINDIIDEITKNTGRKMIFIIDEWDYVIRDKEDDEISHKNYLNFLSSFIKDNLNIDLTYMTGILPIKKYGINSGLAGYSLEYSMTSPKWMAKYVGFTNNEIETLVNIYNKNKNKNKSVDITNAFSNDKNNLESLNEEEERSNKEMIDDLKNWYNGYQLIDENGEKYEIYTPFSIMNAIESENIQNYWIKSETYKLLERYINMNFDGLKEYVAILMDDRKMEIDIEKYNNDMKTFVNKDDILTMLIHLGYLGYNSSTKEVFIPNREVKEEFKKSTTSKEWKYTMKLLYNSEKILNATLSGNESLVAELLEDSHNDVDNRSYNSEDALKFSIILAYIKSRDYYLMIPEVDSGKGYADIMYIPLQNDDKYPPIIVELKHNQCTKSGIKQIEDKKYPSRLEDYYGKIILVCVNYSMVNNNNTIEYKKHECEIKTIIKDRQKKKLN